MPRVHHRKARKDYPTQGIKKGQMYFYWKCKGQSPQRSLTRPKRQQLTSSAYYVAIYDWEDAKAEVAVEDITPDIVENWFDELETIQEEQQERLDEMPEQLQETSSSGELLTNRIDMLQESLDELDELRDALQDLFDEREELEGKEEIEDEDEHDEEVNRVKEEIEEKQSEIADFELQYE